jgi:1-acyl-sn-glycerol-3-phosphate acyltransferase
MILTSPLVTGTENLPNPGAVPRRPVLFVGNHTMFGIYDSPILVHELFLRGFRCRGLAHPGHWTLGVGPIFERYGSVKASKFAAYKLLKVQ